MPVLRQVLRQTRCYSLYSCVKEFQDAKPYSEIPGPNPIPLIGNTWRLMPFVGQYDISDVAKVKKCLNKNLANNINIPFLF